MTENGSFITKKGNTIQLSLYGYDLQNTAPCILYLHGFKGFKDWGFVPVTGKFFEARGFRFLAMNFSHNGIGDDPENFTELDKFRDNTFSLEMEEVLEVVDAYQEGRLFQVSPGARMGLLGHSRGGGIALLAAAALESVLAVCTWAAVSTFKRYPQDIIDAWEKDKVLGIKNSRTGQVMELGWNLHADLMKHIEDKLNIEQAVRGLGKPLCVVHGTNDEAVSLDDAHAIASWGADNLDGLHVIEGAGHTFGARHPFVHEDHQLDAVWSHTMAFFTKYLK